MDLVATVAHLPQPGETVLGRHLGTYPGGKGANQAVAAARLGGQVALVGRVGNDNFGAALIENLKANAVDSSGVERDPEAATGAALIYVEDGGQNMIAVAPGANATISGADVQRAASRLTRGDVLTMQLEIPIPAIREAVTAAHQAGAFVLLNAAPAQRLDSGLLRHVDALVVNEREAKTLVEQELSLDAAASALHVYGPNIVIITLGAAGCVFCDDSGVHRVEPFPVKAKDTTGAGDAFMGALAVWSPRLPREHGVK